MIGALSPGRTLLGIPWYSLLIVCAIILATWLCSREEARLRLPKDTVIDLALWLIPGGIVGARLYYVAFEWERFASRPLSVFYIWEGGIAIYGALIGGGIAAFLFARKKRLSLSLLADMVLPTVALAQGIGRWGNYFNMEAYGEAIIDPSWKFFPFGVLIPHADGYAWHLATFFYESIWDLGVFAVLWYVRKRVYRQGDVALWYILLYGPGRAFIEGLRTDSLYAGGGVRISQWLSLAACLYVCCLFVSRGLKQNSGAVLKARLILNFLPCITGLAALLLSAQPSLDWRLRALPSWAGLIALIVIPHPIGIRPTAFIASALLPVAQILALWQETSFDPLLFKTIQMAIAGLSFPAVGYLLYPSTVILKEESPCGT